MVFIFNVIAAYKNREACEILAGYLRASLEDDEKAKHVTQALMAFGTATGKYFMVAGAPRAGRLPQVGQEAVKWWSDEGRRQFSEAPSKE